MPEPIFRIRGLTKRYGEKVVLDDLDFDVYPGECLVILGRSGSGKSVTLRHLNGLEKPDSGSVVFDGVEISALEERELHAVRRRVSMLFQGSALFDSMSVFENIAFPIREHTERSDGEVAEKVRDLLALVRLGDVEDRMPAALSGGMKKRVALARSLALDPEVVLFDEPTTGLDPMTSATIAELIRSSREKVAATSVVVTHDIALARRVGDRVAFLEGGHFRFLGTWDQVDQADDRMFLDFLAGRQEDVDAA